MVDGLCTAMGRTDMLTDPRFETPAARGEHAQEFREAITAFTMEHDKREVMQILGHAGVPVSYVFDTMDLFTDEHLQARGFIKEVQHPVNGTVRLMSHPLRMEGTVPQDRAPLLGEHTDEILGSLLGLDSDALAALNAEGVTAPTPY
jgi:formyl-CoA transferase